MAIAALTLFAVMMLLSGAVRTLIQRHRTGDTGNRRTLQVRGSLEWWALGVADAGYLMTGLAAPLADLAGLGPFGVADRLAARGLGVAVAALGILATFGAQLALGASWRIGIDEAERTALITSGPFRLVRNPIFTAVAVTFFGLALTVPNVVAAVGLALTILGIEMQVRLVEEPYLRRAHGTAYLDYASRVGRFLPGIGRQRPEHRYRA